MLARKIGFFLGACIFTFVLFHGFSIACPDPWGGWIHKGDVNIEGRELNFGDDGESWSYAYKYFPEGRGVYRISFDFRNELSPVPYEVQGGNFAFLDTFYASLYFVDSCCRFDLETCSFCYGIPLFDLDANGPRNIEGEIGDSELGAGWRHFEMVFRSQFQKVIPAFELFEHNYINDDSEVIIANVSISQVPLPSSLFFLGGGIVMLVGKRLRKRSSSRE